MLRSILITCWALVAAVVLLLTIMPKRAILPFWFPDGIRLFLVLLVLVSIVYGVRRMYLRGMAGARDHQPEGRNRT